MPYRTAVEYCLIVVPDGIIEIEVMAAVFDQRLASRAAVALVALFSVTISIECDLLVEPS